MSCLGRRWLAILSLLSQNWECRAQSGMFSMDLWCGMRWRPLSITADMPGAVCLSCLIQNSPLYVVLSNLCLLCWALPLFATASAMKTCPGSCSARYIGNISAFCAEAVRWEGLVAGSKGCSPVSFWQVLCVLGYWVAMLAGLINSNWNYELYPAFCAEGHVSSIW